MLLKKSENALSRFFRKEAQLNFIADKYGTQAVVEAACEFFH